jgi:hypothetical protein
MLSALPCDVLNLEWRSSGRDRETASLICNTLRRRGYTVVEASVFQYRAAIARHRPRLLYLADPRGATLNYEAAQFARSRGLPIVTATAEGNFKPERIHEMFWGHVREGRMVEDLNLQWSVRARDLALGVEPSLAAKLRVVGGVGFDRYRLYDFATKDGWMAKHGLRFDRMVGYASWTFDRLHREDEGVRWFKETMGDAGLERLAQDRDGVAGALARLAEHNPNTLFLLKEHPGVVAPRHTEIAALEERANVMIVRNEEPIGDCIGACDIWMAFDSTTCLEAWLLGKPTLLINPTGEDFERDETYLGSPVARDADEVQAALESWYRGEGVPGFADRASARREVIERTIQWDDGRNHLRAVYFIEELLERCQERPRIGLLDRVLATGQRMRFRFGPGAERFKEEQLAQATERCMSALDRADLELTRADLDELERINSGAG